jgi:hypothetical protein
MPRHRSYSETPQLLHNTISIGRDAAPRTLHAFVYKHRPFTGRNDAPGSSSDRAAMYAGHVSSPAMTRSSEHSRGRPSRSPRRLQGARRRIAACS